MLRQTSYIHFSSRFGLKCTETTFKREEKLSVQTRFKEELMAFSDLVNGNEWNLGKYKQSSSNRSRCNCHVFLNTEVLRRCGLWQPWSGTRRQNTEESVALQDVREGGKISSEMKATREAPLSPNTFSIAALSSIIIKQ